MDSLGPWKLTKYGFWLGVGFVLPMLAIYVILTAAAYAVPSWWRASTVGERVGVDETASEVLADFDKSKQIRIIEFREARHGKQLLILGRVENTGPTAASTIQLEAELLDDSKRMVFECSEYVSKRLKPGEIENFQIKCGCGTQPLPAYKTVSVRVVGAMGI